MNNELLTASLTEEEVEIAKVFARSIAGHVGEGNAITSVAIGKAFQDKFKIKVEGPRLRKIVNYIRLNKMVRGLVATSNGYYVEKDRDALARYVESLKSRAGAILEVAESYRDEL